MTFCFLFMLLKFSIFQVPAKKLIHLTLLENLSSFHELKHRNLYVHTKYFYKIRNSTRIIRNTYFIKTKEFSGDI